jgi:hypothetical protein
MDRSRNDAPAKAVRLMRSRQAKHIVHPSELRSLFRLS